MVVWLNASQWHEMFCHDPDITGLNHFSTEVD